MARRTSKDAGATHPDQAGSPLLARIIRHEQDLEAAIEEARELARGRIDAAREEAARLLAVEREEVEVRCRAIAEEAARGAREEAEKILSDARGEAEASGSFDPAEHPDLLDRLMAVILPETTGGEGT